MQTERRCVQRKRPGGISYFEFEAGSGGIVLDASEKGLGFQAADEVYQQGRSRIWISPRPGERIELTGDVVWTDSSRKTGGLRFTEIGADGSKKLRHWLGQADEAEVSPRSEGVPQSVWTKQAVGDLRHESWHDANLSRSTVVAQAKRQVELPVELHPMPGLPSLFTSGPLWQPQDSPASEGRIAYRVATGFLVVVLAIAGVVLLNMFRPNVGELLIHLGEKISGSTNLQLQNSSPLPSSAQAPAQPAPASEAKPDPAQTEAKPDVVQGESSEDSDKPADSSRQVNTQTSDPTIPQTTRTAIEAPNRMPHGGATSSSQDRSAEVTRLWSEVTSGDSSAEVDLARLYVRGEGVPRNCLQARVLLRAAAKNGSAEARQQLKRLRSSGCR